MIGIREGKVITITSGIILTKNDISLTRKVVLETENRIRFSGRIPVPNDIIDQLAIRSIYLKENSSSKERKAIRTIIAQSIGIRREELNNGNRIGFGTAIPEFGDFPEWFLSSSWTELILLHGRLKNTTSKDLRMKGKAIINEVSTPLMPHYPLLLASDIQFMATGVSTNIFSTAKRRPYRISNQPIHRDDLEKLLTELGPDTELDGFCSLITGKNNYPGLARLLARAIWLTGMRTSEMFTCKVADKNTGNGALSFLDTSFFMNAERDTDQQVTVDWLEEFDQILEETIASFSCEGVVRGLSLYVVTPEIGNSSNWIDKMIRVQKLDGINQKDLKTILRFSCIRKLHLSSRKKSQISKYCSRILGDNSEHVFPDRRDRITFHNLRHTFMDEAMKSLPLKEACAIGGLTSKRTMKRYCNKYSGYKQRRQYTRWLPKPDEQAMVRIRNKVESKMRQPMENDMKNADHTAIPDKGLNEPKGKDHVSQPEPDPESGNAIGIVKSYRKKILGFIGKIEKRLF